MRSRPLPRRLKVEALEARDCPAFLTSTPAYLEPLAPGLEIKPVLTTGDGVGGYRFAGVPDGMGAYDNNDGTFTLLINHELGNTLGAVHDHGAKGAFVSKWVLNKSDLSVVSGDDLIKSIQLYNTTTHSYDSASAVALTRLCSADLAEPTAFYNPSTRKGTQERLLLNGEETGGGRGFATVVTGPNAGKTFELPWVGKMAFENVVASPMAQDKTVLAVLDDSSRTFSSEASTTPSEVYFYVGAKRSAGTELERAGLVGGLLSGVQVKDAAGAAVANEAGVVDGAKFTLVGLGDVSGKTAAQLQTDSIASTVTQFRRVEDGAWDPKKPNDFYFVTTDQFTGTTKLWRLRFTDVRRPELGGTISAVVQSANSDAGRMFDNIAVNQTGQVLIQEDPGNQAYVAKIRQYDSASGDLTTVAQFDPAQFVIGGANYVGTQDEESSGVIDLSKILGPGRYAVVAQVHKTNADPELVEGGQLMFFTPLETPATLDAGLLTVQGGIGNDTISVARVGRQLRVTVNGAVQTFDANQVTRLRIDGGAGGDTIAVSDSVIGAVVTGGDGNDRITGGGARSVLIGGSGSDIVTGVSGRDLLFAGALEGLSEDDLTLLRRTWTSGSAYADRVQDVREFLGTLAAALVDTHKDTVRGAPGKSGKQSGQNHFWLSEDDDANDSGNEYRDGPFDNRP